MKKKLWLLFGCAYFILAFVTWASPKYYFSSTKYINSIPDILGIFDIADWISLIIHPLGFSLIGAFLVYPILGAAFFLLGALFGKIVELACSNTTLLLAFLSLMLVLLGLRAYEYKQKYFATSIDDCMQHSSDYGGLDQVRCLFRLAKEKKDITICSKVPEYEQEGCYISVATYGFKDYGPCGAAPTKKIRERCISSVANMKGECEKSFSPNQCYRDRARDIRMYARDGYCDIYKDYSIINYDLCLKIRSGTLKVLDLCKDISNEHERKLCLNSGSVA